MDSTMEEKGSSSLVVGNVTEPREANMTGASRHSHSMRECTTFKLDVRRIETLGNMDKLSSEQPLHNCMNGRLLRTDLTNTSYV